MKKNETLSIAIHQKDKARETMQLLEKNGIAVVLNEISLDMPYYSIAVNKEDVPRALQVLDTKHDVHMHVEKRRNDEIKRVLVPVDFSNDSLNACRFAFSVAESITARIQILYVFNKIAYPIQMPFVGSDETMQCDNPLTLARTKMLALCHTINGEISKGTLPSINYSYTLREGNICGEIESFIEEYHPTLIVMGTRGLGSKNKNHAGSSVAADIIETTNIPTIAIPYASPLVNLSNVKSLAYLANTLDHTLRFDELEQILVNFSQMKITIVHLNVKGQHLIWKESDLKTQREVLMHLYPQLDIDFRIVNTEDLIQGMENMLTQTNADLVVLNTKQRDFWGIVFKPSVSRKIISQTNTAIMVLRK